MHTSLRRLCAPLIFAGLLMTSSAASAQESSNLADARAAYDSGSWDSALDLYDTVYQDDTSTHGQRVEAAVERATILWEQGSYTSAKALAEEALELAERERIDGAVGRLMVTIGHIETSQGQFSRAKKTFKICASLSEEGQDAVFAAICRMNLSMINRLHGKMATSDAQFKRDIAAIKGAKTPLAAGSALAKTGEMFAQSGDLARALEMLEQAQAQFVDAGSTPAQARNRIRIARVLQSGGDYDRARAHLKLAKDPLVKMKNRPALVDIYGLLGKDAEVGGDREGAVGYYKKSLKTAKAIGNPQLTARSHLAMCELLTNPLTEGAGPHCDSAATRFAKLKIPVLEVRAKIAQASIHQQNGELMSARDLYKDIIDTMESKLSAAQRDASTLATHRANYCQLNNALELTGALLSCQAAIDALKDLPDASTYVPHLAATYYNAAFSAQREDRLKTALKHFKRAAKLYAETSEPLRSADSHLRRGIIYSAVLKGESNSITSFKEGLEVVESASGESARVMKTQLYQQLVQELVSQEKWEQAITSARELIAFATTHDDHAAAAHAYNNLAVASLKLKDRDTAIGALESGIEHAKKSGEVKAQLKLMQKNLKALRK